MPWLYRPTGRSCPCNGKLLRYYRQLRGWTQQQLAGQTGYTTRLIAKAEAGGNVHPDTLETIAACLSTPSRVVHPEDLSASPALLAKEFLRNYAQYERQVVAKCQSILSDDMSAWVAGDPEIIPFSGTHNSIDGFDNLWGEFFGVFTRPQKKLAANPLRVVAEGRDTIAIIQEQVKVSGHPLAPPSYVTLRFAVERGRIVRFEDYFDHMGCAEVLRSIRARNAAEQDTGKGA